MSFLALCVYAGYTGGMLLAEKINSKPFVSHYEDLGLEQQALGIKLQLRQDTQDKIDEKINREIAKENAILEQKRQNHGYLTKEEWREARLKELTLRM